MRGRHYCWVLFLLMFSALADASSISYWQYLPTNSSSYTEGHYPDAFSACSSANPNGNPTYRLSNQTSTQAWCYRTVFGTESHIGYVHKINQTCQYGNTGLTCNTSCPSPGTMQNGQCVMPACPVGQKRDANGSCQPYTCQQDSSGDPVVYSPEQDKCQKYYNLDPREACDYFGQNKTPTHQNYSVISSDPDGMDQAVDNFKCGFDVTSKDCKTNVSGLHTCVVSGTSNGRYYPDATDNNVPTCPTKNCTSRPETPEPEPPQPETNKDSKPCNYTSVNGALECTSSNTTEQEGTKNCGVFQGQWGCHKSPPSKNGIEVWTRVTTEPTSDGGTKTTKTDTATQTKCTDIGFCVTKTTTTTTTTTKDGQGNTTGTTGTCKGDNCPDKNTNPDGDGDGFGDCIGDDCGDNDVKVGAQDWYEPGDDTYSSVIGDFADSVSGVPIISGLTNFITFSPTGSCPIWQGNVWVFDIRIDQFCQDEIPWDLIRAVVIACCAFVAFRIAFT